MEPLSYLMMYGNFNLSFLFYLGVKRDLLSANIHTILQTRFAQSAARRQGIDTEMINKLKIETAELKAWMQQNTNWELWLFNSL